MAIKNSLQKADELGRELGVGRVEAPNLQPGKKTDVNGSVQPTSPSSNQQSPTFAQNWQTGVDTLARWIGNTFGGNNNNNANVNNTSAQAPATVSGNTTATPTSSGSTTKNTSANPVVKAQGVPTSAPKNQVQTTNHYI